MRANANEMKKLSLDLEKLIFVSSVGISCLLASSAISSDGCDVQTPLWNQQLQSTESFGSLAIDEPAGTFRLSIPTFDKPFTKSRCH